MAQWRVLTATIMAGACIGAAAAAPKQPVPPSDVLAPEPPPPAIDNAPPDRFAPPIKVTPNKNEWPAKKPDPAKPLPNPGSDPDSTPD